ncbi:hypothetical protein DET49_12012 [Salegentibacter sp. 24]|uniref:hypothetical protein n=1 Tax=Salegentibacter sp. 24 TaxID=2183986 RepID=UPI00105E5D75|nr:hypothetical protein [Salegentibacter sp. 24]TDN83813.1 hypothetical protein DET49_12012 [Salegentibacter sp. 24]
MSYSSDAILMGRRDSVTAPYIMPSVGYYNRSGFYADASLSYLVKDENRVDMGVLSAGYRFDANGIYGGIAATKYFFNEESYNVQSQTSGNVMALLGYEFNFLELSVMGSAYFSEDGDTDFFAGVILDNTLSLIENKLIFNPSFRLNASSQYFYQEYYQTSRLGNRKRKNVMQQVPVGTIELEEASNFNILSVELSLPVSYYHNQFIFYFKPHLAFPEGESKIITQDAVYEETLDDIFYFSVGIGYWLIP